MQSHKYFYINQLFSAHATIGLKDILNCFLVHENIKKTSLKVAHNS